NANATGFNITTTRNGSVFTGVIDPAIVTDGVYRILALANDSVSNINSSIANVSFTLDKSPPSVSLGMNFTNGSNFSSFANFGGLNKIELSVTSNDTTTYTRNVILSVDNANATGFNITTTRNGSVFTGVIDPAVVADGVYRILALANDSVSNINSSIANVTFRIDRAPPPVSLGMNFTNATTFNLLSRKKITFTIVSNDSTTYTQNIRLGINNANGTELNLSTTRNSSVFAAELDLATVSDGTYVVTAYANDSVANVNSSIANVSFVLSIIAPNFTSILNTSENFRRYQNFTASTLIEDANIDYYIFATNASGSWANVTVDISSSSFNASHSANITMAKNSRVCWYYWANDTNTNADNSSLNCFTVRNSPPLFNMTLENKTALVGITFTYDINCSDVDEDAITYSDDSSLFDISAEGTISLQASESQIGSYTAQITCSDGDLNSSQAISIGITSASSGGEGPAPSSGTGGGGGVSRAACYSDADCGGKEFIDDKFCKRDGVYQKLIQYRCTNPGTSSAACTSEQEEEIIESCDFGCKDAHCLALPESRQAEPTPLPSKAREEIPEEEAAPLFGQAIFSGKQKKVHTRLANVARSIWKPLAKALVKAKGYAFIVVFVAVIIILLTFIFSVTRVKMPAIIQRPVMQPFISAKTAIAPSQSDLERINSRLTALQQEEMVERPVVVPKRVALPEKPVVKPLPPLKIRVDTSLWKKQLEKIDQQLSHLDLAPRNTTHVKTTPQGFESKKRIEIKRKTEIKKQSPKANKSFRSFQKEQGEIEKELQKLTEES
ncbi:hypothetical protein HYX14_04755, partial [Candidatus Woesearchaeota archaeon]|nr:hypothetical protein [Candidatus Woesearchaeota archaeon]